MGKDRKAPEIILPGSGVVYAVEAGEESLFQGVTAYDEEDGELTGEVVIEKIVTDQNKETATVTYGVADRAGNVGKATCTVEMIPETMQEEAVGLQEELPDTAETVREEGTGEAEPEEEEEDTETETAQESSEEETEEETQEEDESQETGEETQEEDESRETGEENGSQEAVVQTVDSSPEPGRPSIVLKAQEVKTKAGMAPAWVQVLEGLHDDKDDYETLLKSLKINGEYNRDAAGTYAVTLTVTDSDGQESDAYPMNIIVEE